METTGEKIEVGFHAFVSGDCEEFGAVREVFSNGIIVYVENSGDFLILLDAVEAVHSQKVILAFLRAPNWSRGFNRRSCARTTPRCRACEPSAGA
jgi:hypothetical protein